MPFVSEAQRRWMYANRPQMARRWERETRGELPARAVHKAVHRRRRRHPAR